MAYTASELYGGVPSPQPTNNATPGHIGGPEPVARTTPRPGGPNLHNPTVLLLVLLGAAIVLIRFSGGFSFGINASVKK